MNTTKGNKVIAKFMNIDTAFDGRFSINPRTKYGCWEMMVYHCDWNWLMEVVKKITLLDEFQYKYEFNSLFWEEFNQLDIEAIYTQVVLFIKWYNRQK